MLIHICFYSCMNKTCAHWRNLLLSKGSIYCSNMSLEPSADLEPKEKHMMTDQIVHNEPSNETQYFQMAKPPWAVLYYTSCWDCVGMKFEIVGIDPNSYHPKPRPTTPQDSFKTFLILYQKENYRNTWQHPFQNSSQQNPTNHFDFLHCAIIYQGNFSRFSLSH